MFKYMKFTHLPVFALALTVAACGKQDADDDTLARDLDLITADTLALSELDDAEPAPTAAPAPAPAPRPAPSAPRPTPAPSKPATSSGNTASSSRAESGMGTIAAGTTLDLTSNARVCTNTHKVGDKVNASVSQAVTGSNGAVIPAGATVALEVTQLKRSENINDDIVMGFAVRSITFNGRTYNTSASVTYAQVDKVRSDGKGKDAKKVATGAAVGAILGQVIGKDTRGTVTGAAAGAAAGAIGAATTANFEGCVPQGGRFTVSLSEGVQVHS